MLVWRYLGVLPVFDPPAMSKRRHRPEQIINKLPQAEVALAVTEDDGIVATACLPRHRCSSHSWGRSPQS